MRLGRGATSERPRGSGGARAALRSRHRDGSAASLRWSGASGEGSGCGGKRRAQRFAVSRQGEILRVGRKPPRSVPTGRTSGVAGGGYCVRVAAFGGGGGVWALAARRVRSVRFGGRHRGAAPWEDVGVFGGVERRWTVTGASCPMRSAAGSAARTRGATVAEGTSACELATANRSGG